MATSSWSEILTWDNHFKVWSIFYDWSTKQISNKMVIVNTTHDSWLFELKNKIIDFKQIHLILWYNVSKDQTESWMAIQTYYCQSYIHSISASKIKMKKTKEEIYRWKKAKSKVFYLLFHLHSPLSSLTIPFCRSWLSLSKGCHIESYVYKRKYEKHYSQSVGCQ